MDVRRYPCGPEQECKSHAHGRQIAAPPGGAFDEPPSAEDVRGSATYIEAGAVGSSVDRAAM